MIITAQNGTGKPIPGPKQAAISGYGGPTGEHRRTPETGGKYARAGHKRQNPSPTLRPGNGPRNLPPGTKSFLGLGKDLDPAGTNFGSWRVPRVEIRGRENIAQN